MSGLRRRFGSGAGYQVPGARYPGPGTRYQAPVFEKPAHGVCMAWLGPWGAASCLSRSRLALEPTGDDRARGPDIRLPSAGPSWSVLTTSNPFVPTRSFSSDRLPAVSPFSYVPATSQATSQATYRLRSRLRSNQEGILRGFDRGFWGKGSRAGNPAMAKGYGQSLSFTITIAMLCKALHGYAWHCYAMQSVERAGAEWGDALGRPEGGRFGSHSRICRN